MINSRRNFETSDYEPMTGVLNKQAITEYAQSLTMQSPKKQFYIFIMDIDNFKSVNDTFGHMKGDEVIVEVARIAKECVGDKGLIGRVGGDEFVLVLEEICEEEKLRDVLRNIRYTIREKYKDKDNDTTITASLGGCLFPDYASNYEEMFMLADKMLYIAKAKGRDRYVIYTPAVHGSISYDGKVLTLSQHMTKNREKNSFIMNSMEGFLCNKDISVRSALEGLMYIYQLDSVYIIDKNTGKSRYGLKKTEVDGEITSEASELDLSVLLPEDYQPYFETYPIKVINMYDLFKENYKKLADFMVLKDYRILVSYYLRNIDNKGYILFVNNTTSACRFSETDFADLTYFSRMLELSGNCP